MVGGLVTQAMPAGPLISFMGPTSQVGLGATTIAPRVWGRKLEMLEKYSRSQVFNVHGRLNKME